MKALRRLWSRLLVRTEVARRPARGLIATAQQRLAEGLRHNDWDQVLDALDRLHVVIRPTEDGLDFGGDRLPASLQEQVLSRRAPLLEALRQWAQQVSPLGQTQLFQTWRLDACRTSQLIAAGADLRVQDRLGRTALHEAVTHQNLTVVELLVAAGAPMAAADQGWRTPLHLACEDGSVDLVKALLAGPDPPVNAQDQAGRTPLHLAARDARAAVVGALLAAGAEVDPGDRERLTPLYLAVQRGDEGTVTALLEGGADPGARGATPSPLRLALERGRTAIACRLIQHGAAWEADEAELLTAALRHRDHDLLGAALGRGVRANLQDGAFLVEAVHLDDAMAVDMLLRSGAPSDAGENLPLKLAVYHGRSLIAGYLKAAGASLDPPVQIYEVRLNERPFRFHLDLPQECIVRSEVWRDDLWNDVESETAPAPEPTEVGNNSTDSGESV